MHDLVRLRRAFRLLALAASAASSILAFVFGINQSPQFVVAATIAVFFVAVAFAADYIWLFVYEAFCAGRKGLATGLAFGGAVLLALNMIAHVGSVGWHRDMSQNEASVANVKFDDARNQVADSQKNLAMFREHLAKLQEQAPWVATVTADGLKAELAVADEAIAQEAARGGCKSKCLALKASKADLEKRIGQAEKAADLQKQIEATQRILSGHRTKAAGTERKVAASASQSDFFASLVTFSLKPTEEATTWTGRGVNTGIAIGLCLAPILFSLVGWGVVGMFNNAAAPDQGSSGSSVAGHTSGNSSPLVPHTPHPAPGGGDVKVIQQRFSDPRLARAAADILKGFALPQARTA